MVQFLPTAVLSLVVVVVVVTVLAESELDWIIELVRMAVHACTNTTESQIISSSLPT